MIFKGKRGKFCGQNSYDINKKRNKQTSHCAKPVILQSPFPLLSQFTMMTNYDTLL